MSVLFIVRVFSIMFCLIDNFLLNTYKNFFIRRHSSPFEITLWNLVAQRKRQLFRLFVLFTPLYMCVVSFSSRFHYSESEFVSFVFTCFVALILPSVFFCLCCCWYFNMELVYTYLCVAPCIDLSHTVTIRCPFNGFIAFNNCTFIFKLLPIKYAKKMFINLFS